MVLRFYLVLVIVIHREVSSEYIYIYTHCLFVTTQKMHFAFVLPMHQPLEERNPLKPESELETPWF